MKKLNKFLNKKTVIIIFSFSIIISLLLAIISVLFGYNKGSTFCGSTKQEKSFFEIENKEIFKKIEILNDKSDKSLFDGKIKFTKCDNLSKYKNKEFFYKTDKNLKNIADKIFDKNPGYVKGIIEYCKTQDSKKYLITYSRYNSIEIYQYDLEKDLFKHSDYKGYFNKSYLEDNYDRYINGSRNYGDTSLEKDLEKYIKQKSSLSGFGLKNKNIIPFSVYGTSMIGCAEGCAPGFFQSGKGEFVSKKTIKYCNSGLTKGGKLSVCFADIFYDYNILENTITEKRICTYYIDDDGNIGKLEKCINFNIESKGYKLKSLKKGLKFYQNSEGDLSIIEINLDKIGLSFGGIKKNEEFDFEEFNRFYAKDIDNKIKSDFFKNKYIFAAINGQFFTNTKNEQTGLSFPLKSEGKIITDYLDNKIPKRTFVIDKSGNAKILEGYKKEFLENNKYNEVIVAFTPEVDARRNDKIGRTYIGLKYGKEIVFFITKNKNQEQMNKIISDYGIKKENIIMMDGGPSSQFSYYENNGPGSEFEQFYGGWKVPQFFVIYKK